MIVFVLSATKFWRSKAPWCLLATLSNRLCLLLPGMFITFLFVFVSSCFLFLLIHFSSSFSPSSSSLLRPLSHLLLHFFLLSLSAFFFTSSSSFLPSSSSFFSLLLTFFFRFRVFVVGDFSLFFLLSSLHFHAFFLSLCPSIFHVLSLSFFFFF